MEGKASCSAAQLLADLNLEQADQADDCPESDSALITLYRVVQFAAERARVRRDGGDGISRISTEDEDELEETRVTPA